MKNRIIEKNNDIGFDEKEKELYGNIYFPLFNASLEVYSIVYQEYQIPNLEDAKEVAKYLYNLRTDEKVYTDFVEGVCNFYYDVLNEEIKEDTWHWRSEYTDLGLIDTDENIVNHLKPTSIGIMKNNNEIAFEIVFDCPWEPEHGLGWIVSSNKTISIGWGGQGHTPWSENVDKFNFAPMYCTKISKPIISHEFEEKFYETRKKYKKEKNKITNQVDFKLIFKGLLLFILIPAFLILFFYTYNFINKLINKKPLDTNNKEFSLDYDVPSRFKLNSESYSLEYGYENDKNSCIINIYGHEIYENDFNLMDKVKEKTTQSQKIEEKIINGNKWIVTYSDNNDSRYYYSEFDGSMYEIRYDIYRDDDRYCYSNIDEFTSSLKFKYLDKELTFKYPYGYNNEENYINKTYYKKDDNKDCSIGIFKEDVNESTNVEEVLIEDMKNQYGGYNKTENKYINGYNWLYSSNDNNYLYYYKRNNSLYKIVFTINKDYKEECYQDMINTTKYGIDFELK